MSTVIDNKQARPVVSGAGSVWTRRRTHRWRAIHLMHLAAALWGEDGIELEIDGRIIRDTALPGPRALEWRSV